MATWGMVIDLDRCTGCGACQTACRVENNVAPFSGPLAGFPAGSIPGSLSGHLPAGQPVDWLTVRAVGNGQAFPGGDAVFFPKPCMHCAQPPCVAACPVNATQKSAKGGVVSQVYARCIGCRSCVAACPYGVRVFNWLDPVWPGTMGASLTPFASPRPKGVVEKCTLCSHRLVAGEGASGHTGTACSEACPTGAILFGDLDDPAHPVHALSRCEAAFTLLPHLTAKPQVHYLSRRAWVRRWAQEGGR